MVDLATRSNPAYGAVLMKRRLQIQKPEISTYRPPIVSSQEVPIGVIWKLMVGLTYLFSLITLYFVATV